MEDSRYILTCICPGPRLVLADNAHTGSYIAFSPFVFHGLIAGSLSRMLLAWLLWLNDFVFDTTRGTAKPNAGIWVIPATPLPAIAIIL